MIVYRVRAVGFSSSKEMKFSALKDANQAALILSKSGKLVVIDIGTDNPYQDLWEPLKFINGEKK